MAKANQIKMKAVGASDGLFCVAFDAGLPV